MGKISGYSSYLSLLSAGLTAPRQVKKRAKEKEHSLCGKPSAVTLITWIHRYQPSKNAVRLYQKIRQRCLFFTSTGAHPSISQTSSRLLHIINSLAVSTKPNISMLYHHYRWKTQRTAEIFRLISGITRQETAGIFTISQSSLYRLQMTIFCLLLTLLAFVNTPLFLQETQATTGSTNPRYNEFVEIPVEVERIVTVTVTEYVTTIKEVPVEVEKTISLPVELRQFESPEELRDWLGEEGKQYLLLPPGVEDICWYYALALQERARKAGYDIFFQTAWPEVYNSFFSLMAIDTAHALNATIIKGQVYFIEPQTNEIALAGWLQDWKE